MQSEKEIEKISSNTSLSIPQDDIEPPKLKLFHSIQAIDDFQNCLVRNFSHMSLQQENSPEKGPLNNSDLFNNQENYSLLRTNTIQPQKIEEEQLNQFIDQQPQEQPQVSTIQLKQTIITEETQTTRPKRKASKAIYNSDDSPNKEQESRFCNCSNSKCLQLYCSCFHNKRTCAEECKCKNCFNDGQHEHERLRAIEKIKVKEQRESSHDIDKFDTKQIWGCNCKKTNCIKGYCECYIRGKKCTSRCHCKNCDNRKQGIHLKITKDH